MRCERIPLDFRAYRSKGSLVGLVLFAFTAVAVVGIPPRALAQGSHPSTDPLHMASRQELDVIKVLVSQERAWNSGDIDGFMHGYKESPDTLFIGRQVSKGFNEINAEYKHDYPSRSAMGQLGYCEIEVHPLS